MSRFLPLLVLLLALPALAQPQGVVVGEDLGAWREIHEASPRGDEAIETFQWFIATYPTSPLAEVAWARLRELGGAEAMWDSYPALRPVLLDIERSLAEHDVALARQHSTTAVATIRSDDSPRRNRSRARRWRVLRRRPDQS